MKLRKRAISSCTEKLKAGCKEAYKAGPRLNQLEKLTNTRMVTTDIHTRVGTPYQTGDTVDKLFYRLENILS